MNKIKNLQDRITSIISINKVLSAVEKISATNLYIVKQKLINLSYYIDSFSKLINIKCLGQSEYLLVLGIERGMCGTISSLFSSLILKYFNKYKKVFIFGEKTYSLTKNSNLEYIPIFYHSNDSHINQLRLKHEYFLNYDINNIDIINCSDMLLDKIPMSQNIVVKNYSFYLLLEHFLKSRHKEYNCRNIFAAQAYMSSTDMIDDLKIQSNRIRQEQITQELMDIIR